MMKELSQIGLHTHEQKIYLTLLDLGSTSLTTLVDKTKLHRPTVYKHIKILQEKHLVSYTFIGKRKFYSATSPETLNHIAQNIPETIEHIVSTLKPRYERQVKKPHIQWFQGADVATWIYQDVLSSCKKGDIFYRYESPKNYKDMDMYLPKEYFNRVCKKKEIEKFVITNEKTAKTKPSVLERKSTYVPKSFDVFEYDITQIIYSDKVAFIDFQNKLGWIVQSGSFAYFQKQLFRLLFSHLDV